MISHKLKGLKFQTFVHFSSVAVLENPIQSALSTSKIQCMLDETPITYESFRKALKSNERKKAWGLYNLLLHNPKYNIPNSLHPEDHSWLLQQMVLHVHPTVASIRAYRIYNRMKQYNLPLDQRDYYALLLVSLRKNDVDRACNIFQEVISCSLLDSRSASIMLSLYGNLKDLAKITEIWDLIKTVPGGLENPDVWAVGIEAFGNSGGFDTALELFNQYKSLVRNLSCNFSLLKDLKLDRKPFEAMIRAYGKRGQLESAKSLFLELENGQMQSLESFDAIISACKSCHDFKNGLFYWQKLLKFIENPIKRSKGVKKLIPLQSTIITMISFYAENKNLEAVLQLYQEYRRFQPESLELLENLTWALLNLGHYTEAIETYDRLKIKGYEPTDLLSSTVEHFRQTNKLN